jgi:hypothetical protein
MIKKRHFPTACCADDFVRLKDERIGKEGSRYNCIDLSLCILCEIPEE